MSYILGSVFGKLVDATDTSKTFDVNLSGASTGTTLSLQSNQTANRTLNVPDSSTTLVGTDVAQTLSNKTIDASLNTLSNIPNSSLISSSVTVNTGTGLTGGGAVSLGGTTNVSLSVPVSTTNGGTGINTSTAANGALLIGNGTGLSLSTLTSGSGISITNGSGSITITNTGSLSSVSPTSTNATYYPTFVDTQTGSGLPFYVSTVGFTINPSTNAVTLGSLDTFNPILIGTGSTGSAPVGSIVIGVNSKAGATSISIGGGVLAAVTTGSGNICIGGSAGNSITTGSNNIILGNGANVGINSQSAIVIGNGAKNGSTTAVNNILIGTNAGSATLDFNDNIGIGTDVLSSSTASYEIVAIGTNAGKLITTATSCVLIGAQSGVVMDIGFENIAIGAYTINAMTYGAQNVSIGHGAMRFNVTGVGNVVIGWGAQGENTAIGGDYNVALGWESLYFSNGNNNTAVGAYSGLNMTTGIQNTLIGYRAGYNLDDGNNNICIGYNAGNAWNGNEVDCVLIGSYTASIPDGSLFIANGSGDVLCSVGLGSYNSIQLGFSVTNPSTGGTQIGNSAFADFDAVALGESAKSYPECIVIGKGSHSGNNATFGTGNNNIVIGRTAGNINLGVRNTLIGHNVGLTLTGDDCTIIGNRAGDAITTGLRHTAMGVNALSATITNSDCTAVGYNALATATGGSNIGLGSGAGSSITSGVGNVVIGGYTGSGAPISATGSNFLVLSDGQGNVRTYYDSSGNQVRFGGGLTSTPGAAPTIASGTTIAPTQPITFVSGTTTIQTITPPSPISASGGRITLIPTGLWSLSTAGNIAIAATVAIGKALTLSYDVTTTKWYPSYNDPSLTNGQLLIGSTGASPVAATITAGAGMSVTNGAGSITLSTSWKSATTAQQAVSNSSTYISASFPIPANGIVAGMAFKINAMGTYTTSVGSSATFTIRFGVNGTTADTSIVASATTTASSGTNIPFIYSGYVTFRTTTSAIGFGQITNQGTTGISTTTNAMTQGVLVSSLTTSAAFLGLSFTTGNANNTATFQEVIVSLV